MKDRKDADYVRSQLRYEPDTGLLYWKESCSGRNIKKPAGGLDGKGYRRIRLQHLPSSKNFRKKFLAHRLVWLIHNDVWPGLKLDHKDRDRSNNRIDNLREATTAENAINSRNNPRNKTGVIGVYIDKRNNRWISRMRVAGKKVWIGSFSTLEEAKEARKQAELAQYGEFSSYS